MKSPIRRLAGLAVGLAVAVGFGWPAASAAPAVPKPVISKFQLSTTEVPSRGGKVTLTASVSHATSCTFSAKPAVAKLPVTVNCTSGTASKTVFLPANSTTMPKTYQFRLSAKGPGGSTQSASLSASVKPAPPQLISLGVTPEGLPPAGGAMTFTATVAHSATCVLSASPAVTGLPVSFACPAGTSPVKVKRLISLPALTGSSSAIYLLRLKVTGPGGTARNEVTQTVYSKISFAAPVPVDRPVGGLDDLSCSSATFCVAVDSYGNAVSGSGTHWSAAGTIDSLPAGLVTGMSTAVSCVTKTFCAEIAQDGDATFFTGAGWSKPVPTGLGATGISCVSSKFCVAIGGKFTSVYTGSTWSTPTAQVTNTTFVSISCVTSTFCMLVNFAGDAFTFNGTTLSAAVPFDTGSSQVNGVSCHAATLCVAVDGDGFASIYTGATWSTPAKVVTSGQPSGLDAVSCVRSVSFCLATASNGATYEFDGSSWGQANFPQGSLALGAVSCPSSSTCTVLGPNEVILSGLGGTWSGSAQLETTHGFLTAVSCPSTSFCAATDWTDSVLTYNGATWSAPQAVDPGGLPFSAISCASATFCVALEEPGNDGTTRYFRFNGTQWVFGEFDQPVSSVSCSSATFCVALASIDDTPSGDSVYSMIWNGSSWSAPALADSSQGVSPPPGQGYVSCVTKHFCALADTGGNVLTFNGTSWSSPDTVDAGTDQPLTAISCPASNFCTAIDGFGQAFSYNGKTWSGPVGVESDGGVTGISCASARFCVAVDEAGNVDTFYDGTWSAPANQDPAASPPYGITGIACPAVSFCAAVDFEGNLISGTA